MSVRITKGVRFALLLAWTMRVVTCTIAGIFVAVFTGVSWAQSGAGQDAPTTKVAPANGVIKLYYDSFAPCSSGRRCWHCYAVSTDGMHFTKPNLGIVSFAGRTDTNIVWPTREDVAYLPGNDGPIETQLITSRNSIDWYRPERGKAFIPRGSDGSYDDGQTYVMGASNLIYRGNEIWIYYTAQPFTHGDYALSGELALGSVMRAVLRLDGFVSVDAGPQPGQFTTPTMIFSGDQLDFNVDTGGGDHLRVELQDENGQPIEGYSLADCDVVNGNDIRHKVSWKGNSNVSALAGKPLRMRIEMRSTKLFAFQFTP